MAPSAPHSPGGPKQHLWKLVSALGYMAAWKGHLWKNVNTNQTNLEFSKNTTHYVSACVRLPYLLWSGLPSGTRVITPSPVIIARIYLPQFFYSF